MNVLITGNLGYVGPILARHLRSRYPEAFLAGLDTGFFATCLTEPLLSPEVALDCQYFGDVRSIDPRVFHRIDSVIHLAAISNDPMGKAFEGITMEVNQEASLNLAAQAKAAGVKSFAFASSCSVYGFAEEGARSESSPLNPLTAYARSKVAAEEGLQKLAGPDFRVTCLRFATACGWSPRLRLDLVVNDFVASAVATGKITILSDGTPWRPLIDVHDMARAFEWAVSRGENDGGHFVVVNTGSNRWNYQVKELAMAVQRGMTGVEVSINPNAQPDKRSYKVDFSLFERLAPNHQPKHELDQSIAELRSGLEKIGFSDANFRKSRFIRLETLNQLKTSGQLDDTLHWKKRYV